MSLMNWCIEVQQSTLPPRYASTDRRSIDNIKPDVVVGTYMYFTKKNSKPVGLDVVSYASFRLCVG